MWTHRLNEQQRTALMRLAYSVVVSDGILDPNEESMLEALRSEMGIPSSAPLEYVDVIGMQDVFDTAASRNIVILNLLRLSYVDGAFEVEEECTLRELARVFGLTEHAFLRIDNWVRRLIALEKEAVGFIDD